MPAPFLFHQAAHCTGYACPMRILVIGGSRFIGAALVRQLAAAGHTLCLFNRGQSPVEPPAGVEVLHGDRNALAGHAAAVLGWRPDVVVDMCCITAEQCEAALAVFAGNVPRYVLISSCDVYRTYGVLLDKEQAAVDNTPQAEDAPLRTVRFPYRGAQPRAADDPQRILDDYDKIPCEQAVLARPGLAGTVLRLPMVYGPGDYQLRLLPYLRRMDDGRKAILLSETGAGWRGARGYVEDVAAGIALAVASPQAGGCTYNIAEPTGLTERDWVERVGVAAYWDGKVIEVDDDDVPDDLPGLRGAKQHLVVDSGRLRSELGYKEGTTWREALSASVNWQRKHWPVPLPPGMFDYAAEDALLARKGALI
jgi:nucleoside-diphosphate-sugar epimerase